MPAFRKGSRPLRIALKLMAALSLVTVAAPALAKLSPAETRMIHAVDAELWREWPAEWLYHVTKKGVRMTGMPAWEYRLADASLWSTVAFLKAKLG